MDHFQLNLTLSLQRDVLSQKLTFIPRADIQNFFCLVSLVCFLYTFQHFKFMNHLIPSTNFLGVLWFIFVIFNIQSCLPIQHFNLGFIFFFYLYLTHFTVPVFHVCPFPISSCLTSNHCHHLLNILPFSFSCFFILIIWFLPSVVQFLISCLYLFMISKYFNFVTSYFLCLIPCIFLYLYIFCQYFI